MKRSPDPCRHCPSLLNHLSALRATSKVMFYRLPFVEGKPVKDIVIQRFVC